MPDWPEFRSDHDPRIAGTANAPAPPKRPLSKRIRAWAIVAAIYGVIFALAGGGAWYAHRAIRSREWENLPLALGAMAPLIFLVWYFVGNKVKTGSWGGSREERARRAARIQARRAPARVRQARARAGSIGAYLLRWAGYAAFEPTCSLGQRAVAWAVLVGDGLFQLSLAAVGVWFLHGAFKGGNSAGQLALLVGFGLTLVLMPVSEVRGLIRRRRVGSLRVTREEFAVLRAQRTFWRIGESQKPLRRKVISILILVLVEVWWWMRVTVYHSRHPHENWVGPLFSLPAFVWVVWVQLRPPKKQPVASSQ